MREGVLVSVSSHTSVIHCYKIVTKISLQKVQHADEAGSVL